MINKNGLPYFIRVLFAPGVIILPMEEFGKKREMHNNIRTQGIYFNESYVEWYLLTLLIIFNPISLKILPQGFIKAAKVAISFFFSCFLPLFGLMQIYNKSKICKHFTVQFCGVTSVTN